MKTLSFKEMSLTEAIDQVKRLTGTENDTDIELWLEQSAGYTKANIKVYRVYFVCALDLWLRSENNLIKGEGAEFQQNFETTRRYLNFQSLLDLQNDLSIPVAFTVDALLNQIQVQGKKINSSILSF